MMVLLFYTYEKENKEGYHMTLDITKIKGREPLIDYSWRGEVDKLLTWLLDKDSHVRAFCFDVIISAAYIDAASGIEKYIEQCSCVPNSYNAHIGFINLCSPCFFKKSRWSYQKAIKPQSGALGKLSSEVILRFIEKLFPEIDKIIAVGGVDSADAIIYDNSGNIILSEVKSAPLLTYPFVFNLPKSSLFGEHENVNITSSQLKEASSGIYFHNGKVIDLGNTSSPLWPFKPIVDFLTDNSNIVFVKECTDLWLVARTAYAKKDRENKLYYVANASGNPPREAKDRDGWPNKQSISDSKTSAGMDRTDDIKKGIYQTLKIGAQIKNQPNIKTAIISNLPAYRHGEDYVLPFVNMYWGLDRDLQEISGQKAILLDDLRRVFDFVITLEEPILRGTKL